jgi:hypothetical protein
MRPLFKHANQLAKDKQALEQDDLPLLPDFDKGRNVSAVFNRRWTETKNVWKSLYAVLGWRFIIAGAIKVLNSCLQFTFPLILNAILQYIEDRQSSKITNDSSWQDRYRGYILSVLFVVFLSSKAVTESAYFHRINRCAFQARVAVSVAVYNKSLKLANAERQSTTLGELVNLMQGTSGALAIFPRFLQSLTITTAATLVVVLFFLTVSSLTANCCFSRLQLTRPSWKCLFPNCMSFGTAFYRSVATWSSCTVSSGGRASLVWRSWC